MGKSGIRLMLFLLSSSFVLSQQPPDPNLRDRQRMLGETRRVSGRVVATGEGKVPRHTTVTLRINGTAFGQTQQVPPTGVFDFRGVPGGSHFIQVSCPGYEDNLRPVEVGQSAYTGPFVIIPLGKPLDTSGELPQTVNKTVPLDLLNVPKQAIREVEKADRESKKNKPEKAIEHLQKALKIHPDFYHAYDKLGTEYLRLGRRAEAIAALEKSMTLNDQNPVSHFNLGNIYLTDGKYRKALGFMRKAHDLGPENAQTLTLLGYAYLGLGQYQLALSFVQNAVRDNPDNPLACYLLGESQFGLGNYNEALQHFKQFLALESEGARAEVVRQRIAEIPASG